MQIEFGATRVDQQAAGIVVEEKWQMHALAGYLHPLIILALPFPLPRHRSVVVARPRRDGRDHGVRSYRQAAHFHHPHGRAADLR
jgi:hypothetical protein